MIFVSYVLIVVQPISALMLLSLVMRYRRCIGIHWLLRVWLAGLACGLLLHTLGHVELVVNYRMPRTLSWLLATFSLNALIWTAYLTELGRRKGAGRVRPRGSRASSSGASGQTE